MQQPYSCVTTADTDFIPLVAPDPSHTNVMTGTPQILKTEYLCQQRVSCFGLQQWLSRRLRCRRYRLAANHCYGGCLQCEVLERHTTLIIFAMPKEGIAVS